MRVSERLWQNLPVGIGKHPPSSIKKFSLQFLEEFRFLSFSLFLSLSLSLSLSLWSLLSDPLAECRGKSKQKISANSERERLKPRSEAKG